MRSSFRRIAVYEYVPVQVELLRWNERDVTNDGGVFLKVRQCSRGI